MKNTTSTEITKANTAFFVVFVCFVTLVARSRQPVQRLRLSLPARALSRFGESRMDADNRPDTPLRLEPIGR